MDPAVRKKFDTYPAEIRVTMLQLRKLVFEAASQTQDIELEETLKWGEPAYLSNYGSTVRIDWKSKSPDSVYIFFNCKTILVETFKELHFDQISYQGKRAIVLPVSEKLPAAEIKYCVSLALRYHKLKHLPLLGE